jgi:hypothetical protein
MVRGANWVLCAVLGGCWVSEGEIASQLEMETDTGDLNALHITSVNPAYGPSNGGVEVVVTLVESCVDPVVHFGEDSATVTQSAGNQVVVTSPTQGGGQSVDVDVQCAAGAAKMEAAYTVYEDASGLVSSAGEFSWIQYIGEYWNEDAKDFGFAYLYLFKPTDFDLGRFYGSEMDQCVSGYGLDGVPVELLDSMPQTVTLQAGSLEVQIPYVPEENRYATEVSAEEFILNMDYTLMPFGARAPWSTETVNEFLSTPSGAFSISAPAMDGPAPPNVYQSFELVWPGAGQGDYVVAVINRFVEDVVVEEVRCLLTDDGAHQVDSEVFLSWTKRELITIRLGRVMRPDAVFSHDLSGSGFVGIHWVLGAGIQN